MADIVDVPLKVISVRPHGSAAGWQAKNWSTFFNISKQLEAEMIIRFHDFAAEAVADFIRHQPVRALIVGRNR